MKTGFVSVLTPLLLLSGSIVHAQEQGVRDQLRSQVVRLDKDNALNGRVNVIDTKTGKLSPIRKVTVRFIRNGQIKATVNPAADGTFTAKDLTPGLYSMIAAGDDGFLAWAVNIQPRLEDVAKMPLYKRVRYLAQEASDKLVVDSAAVPPSNFTPLKSLLRTYLPEDASILKLDAGEEGEEVPQAGEPGSQLKHHQVQLTRDGRLLGRIRRLNASGGRSLRIRQLNVFLLRNNTIVAQEPVTASGTFAFEDLKPNIYSLVAAGRDGFVAFSVDIVAAPPVTPASFGMQGGPALEFTIAPANDLNQQNAAQNTGNFTGDDDDNQQLAQTPPPPAGAAGAPAPPAPAGGGGGVGTGGGDVLTDALLTGGAFAAGFGVGRNSRGRSSPARPGNNNAGDGGDLAER